MDHAQSQVCWHNCLPGRWDDVVENNFGCLKWSRLGTFGIFRACEWHEWRGRWYLWSRSVLEVLTIAHIHCVPRRGTWFQNYRWWQETSFWWWCGGIRRATNYSLSEEILADVPDAEPFDEDRVIPYSDKSSLIDGISYTHDTPLRGLRLAALHLDSPHVVQRKIAWNAWLILWKHVNSWKLRQLKPNWNRMLNVMPFHSASLLNPQQQFEMLIIWLLSLMKLGVHCAYPNRAKQDGH